MNAQERELYLKLMAEIIVDRENERNGHNLRESYRYELAREVAEGQLKADESYGELRITLEEIVSTTSSAQCVKIIEERMKIRLQLGVKCAAVKFLKR